MSYSPKPWSGTVDIKVFLNDNTLDWRQTAVKIAGKLAENPTLFKDTDLDQDFRDLAEDSEADVEDFDKKLDELYDFADYYRIWLGP